MAMHERSIEAVTHLEMLACPLVMVGVPGTRDSGSARSARAVEIARPARPSFTSTGEPARFDSIWPQTTL